jgi:hypothetical protein
MAARGLILFDRTDAARLTGDTGMKAAAATGLVMLAALAAPAPAREPEIGPSIRWTQRSSHPFKTGRIETYYHFVRSDDGTRRALVMRNFAVAPRDNPNKFSSMIYAQDFDCAARTSRIGLMYWFRDQMGRGAPLRKVEQFSTPQPVKATDEEQFFYNSLCR